MIKKKTAGGYASTVLGLSPFGRRAFPAVFEPTVSLTDSPFRRILGFMYRGGCNRHSPPVAAPTVFHESMTKKELLYK